VTYPVKQQKTQQPWPSRKRVRSEKDRPTTAGHPTKISRASVLRKRRRDPDDLAYAAAEVDPYASRLRMDVRAKARKQQHSAKKLQIIEFDQLTPKDTASSHVHHPVASGVMVPVRLPHAARSVFALLPEEGTMVPYRSQPTLRPAQPPLTIEAAPVAAQWPYYGPYKPSDQTHAPHPAEQLGCVLPGSGTAEESFVEDEDGVLTLITPGAQALIRKERADDMRMEVEV